MGGHPAGGWAVGGAWEAHAGLRGAGIAENGAQGACARLSAFQAGNGATDACEHLIGLPADAQKDLAAGADDLSGQGIERVAKP